MQQIKSVAQKPYRQSVAIYLRPTMNIPGKIEKIGPLQNRRCSENEKQEYYFESKLQGVE
jgi:hypothetical protein